MDDLLQRVLAVNQTWLALGNECFDAACGAFVRNRDVPSIRDANHVAQVTAATASDVDALLARAEEEFAGLPHRAYHIDPETPPGLEARLVLEGYEHTGALYLLLEGKLRGRPRECDIRPVEDEAAWQSYLSLHRADWAESRQALEKDELISTGEAMFRSRRAKSPSVRYWLAYEDGEAKSYLASWEGLDGGGGRARVGQVEDLYTAPEARHRGLATALIHHCVDDCRANGAGPVVIVADPGDTPKGMYAALGFQPIALKRSYWKDVATWPRIPPGRDSLSELNISTIH